MTRVLVWHQGALGDLILSLPAISSIKGNFGHLHLVSRTDIAEIITGRGIADDVSSCDRGIFAPLFIGSGALSGEPASFLKAFDAAFIFTTKTESVFIRNVRALVAKCFPVVMYPPAEERTHVSLFQAGQLRTSGIDADLSSPGEALSASRQEEGKAMVSVHPGSGGRKKCWPLLKYSRLMELIRSEIDCDFTLILGPAEGNDVRKEASSFLSRSSLRISIVDNEPVSSVAGALRASSLYVGNDSGITHLAALLGLPTVAIFGPTDDKVWRPLGQKVRVVRAGAPCSPCRAEAYRSCPGPACLTGLDEEMVFGAVKDLLMDERRNGSPVI